MRVTSDRVGRFEYEAEMTSLNLNQVTPQRIRVVDRTACTKCGAPKEKRVDVGGFGHTVYACGECGHEVKENA